MFKENNNHKHLAWISNVKDLPENQTYPGPRGDEFSGRVDFRAINAYEHPDLMRKLKILSCYFLRLLLEWEPIRFSFQIKMVFSA
jgi:hypothetical protein